MGVGWGAGKVGPPCLSGFPVVVCRRWRSLLLRFLSLARRWRTKQNLDYCFLMMYAQSKGIYYVQVSRNLFSGPPGPSLT